MTDDSTENKIPNTGERHSNPPRKGRFWEKVTRIRHLMRKEFIQLVRNKQNFRILIIAPLFQIFIFGYAVRLDVREVRVVVADMDKSMLSRQLIDSFSQSGYFVIVRHLASYDEADLYLERGDANMALLIPADLASRIRGFRTAEVGILIDGVDTTTASAIVGWSNAIVGRFSENVLGERIGWARGLRLRMNMPDISIPKVTDQPRAWFNPNLTSKDFFVPGIIALILTFFAITVPAMAIVREYERGTIEQIMVTPITRLELILGKLIPCFVISLVNLATLLVIALGWFQPPFRGSMAFFLGTSILYTITCLGIGMTISSFCRTQQQAILSSFMVLQPAVLLSGFAFPIENMPTIIQYVTYANPLRYYIVIVREVFLKGIGWEILWPQVIPITAMGLAYIGLAALLFKKQID